MNVKFLYNSGGDKVSVQLAYEEYIRLTALQSTAAALRAQLEQITQILGASASPAEPVVKIPVTKFITPSAPEIAEPMLEVPDSPTEEVAAEPVEPMTFQAIEPEQEAVAVNVEETLEALTSPVEEVSAVARNPAAPETIVTDDHEIPVPPMMLNFLEQQDPSQKSKRLIMACAKNLSSLCKKRITLSLQKPYICLWDFDEWRTFAFGEIIEGKLYLSIEKSLMPQADNSETWIPPNGLCKTPLVRMRVEAITDSLLTQLQKALNNPAVAAPAAV